MEKRVTPVPPPIGDHGFVRRSTAYEYARTTVRRSILNGELAVGSRLVQSELAASLDVSTTPVREALRDLATEGLVQFDPHRGAIVSEISKEELLDIYEIRLILEPIAMRQAVPKLTDELMVALRRVHQAMLDGPEDSGAWVDRNRVFHMAVYETAASVRLADIIRNLQDASVMYVSAALLNDASVRAHANDDHSRILNALEARDADTAVDEIALHLQASRDSVAAMG
ncbi:MAG: GntR family transcriptional regulator [Acidimicrobiia bacterium]